MDWNGQIEVGKDGKAPSVVPSRQRRVEEGIAATIELEKERDDLQEALSAERTERRALQAELDTCKIAFARAQGEIETYRTERDYSVAKRVEVETLFNAVLEIMQKYKVKPLVEELADSQI